MLLRPCLSCSIRQWRLLPCIGRSRHCWRITCFCLWAHTPFLITECILSHTAIDLHVTMLVTHQKHRHFSRSPWRKRLCALRIMATERGIFLGKGKEYKAAPGHPQMSHAGCPQHPHQRLLHAVAEVPGRWPQYLLKEQTLQLQLRLVLPCQVRLSSALQLGPRPQSRACWPLEPLPLPLLRELQPLRRPFLQLRLRALLLPRQLPLLLDSPMLACKGGTLRTSILR